VVSETMRVAAIGHKSARARPRLVRFRILAVCVASFSLAAIGSAQAYNLWSYFSNATLSQYSYGQIAAINSAGNESVHVAPRQSRISVFYTASGAGIWEVDGTGSPLQRIDPSEYYPVTVRCKNMDPTPTYYANCYWATL
jgi:hypothetical protein